MIQMVTMTDSFMTAMIILMIMIMVMKMAIR